MPIILTPKVGIPLPIHASDAEVAHWSQQAKHAVNAIRQLIAGGAQVSVTDEDRDKSHSALQGGSFELVEENAGALAHLDAILSVYDKELLNTTIRLRSYVTNRLIEESDNGDARIRLKALEMLGKITEVGLFTDQVDVNVTHQSVDQIDAQLATIMEKYMGPAQIVDATLNEGEVGTPEPEGQSTDP